MSLTKVELEALDKIGEGLFAIAHAIHKLGTADAATPMGAIESMTVEIKDCLDMFGDKIGSGLDRIAEAVDGTAEYGLDD